MSFTILSTFLRVKKLMAGSEMTKYEEIQKNLKSNKFTWLITGVAGFIGSNLLEKLLLLGQNVVGIDNFATGYQHNIDQALEEVTKINGDENLDNFTFIEGDILNIDDCNKACENVDFILHHAALGSVPRSIEDPILTNQVNINGFLNMLVVAKESKVKRFIYAASSSTYGDHPDLPKVEDRIGNPLSPYAVTKLTNELYAQVFAKTFGLDTIGLRYFNIFGKRQDPNGSYAAVIPKWTEALINGKELFINGNGETSRDFCYIENTIQINLLAATSQNPDAMNQVYNVAFNQRTSLNELYKLIKERVTGQCLVSNNDVVYRDFRKGDVLHSQADISKAKRLLDYQPSHNVKQGLDEAMAWYVKSLK